MESSSDESSEGPCWIDVFVNYKGNEIFCEVDKEYILDRFNLTGLNAEIPRNYQKAIDLMCDKIGKWIVDSEYEMRMDMNWLFILLSLSIDFTDMNEVTHAEINNCAFFLYGLIHARFILTSRGLSRMVGFISSKISTFEYSILLIIVGKVQEGWFRQMPQSFV
jgi:casein kinase II subunit beta